MARKRNTESETRLTGATAVAREKFKPTRSKHTTKTSPETTATEPVAAADLTISEPVAVESTAVVAAQPTLSHHEVAALAYSYWVGRGCQGGSPEEDWLRAEAELQQR
jgi:Protein of unknown function (DUF2934)